MENADKIGTYLLMEIRNLAKRYEAIGDVRGAGMYIGVEMVKDRTTKEPDADRTLAIVNGLRDRRVLISATGFHSNNLKIRPPLIFNQSHADRLISELDQTLNAVCH